MKRATRILLFASLWFAAGAAMAASYTVEILVFARDNPGASEYFPVDPGVPDYDGVSSLGELGGAMMDPAQGRLGPEEYTLRRSGGMEPVFHGVWRQRAGTRQSPQEVRISSGAEIPGVPPMVEGVVALGRGRYLHLDIDLVMRGPQVPVSPEAFRRDESQQRYQRYRVIANRKMGANRLHYIDHPKMGVLVKIYP